MKKIIRFVAGSVLVCLLLITSISGAYAATGLTTAPDIATDQQKAIDLLNADRKVDGLPPLKVDPKLAALAQKYAQDMMNRRFFSHTNPEGQSPFDRMRAAGISYGYAGENLAINNSVSGAEQAFMNSPEHRANILNQHYTTVGVGVINAPNGTVYVAQEFTDK